MLTTTTNIVTYSTNGSTTVFAVPFTFWDTTDLVVVLRNNSTGVETTLTITTHYTVTGGEGSTGSVTTVSTYASGYKLQIKRIMPLKQEIDLSDNDELPAESLEKQLDKIEAQVQQINTEQSFNLKGSSFTTGFDFTLPTTLTADRGIKVNAAGTGFELTDADPDAAADSAAAAAASAVAAASSASDAQTAENAAEAAQAAAEAAQAAAEAAVPVLASQAEAEAGTDNTKYMSSLRVAQAITAQVSVGDRYVSRGNVSSFDFTPTRDSNFNDIDCSAIVPAGAKRIKFAMVISTTASSGSGNYYTMILRKNGSTSTVCEASVTVQAITGTQQQFSAGEVECDTSRIIECQVDSNANAAYLAVVGWYV